MRLYVGIGISKVWRHHGDRAVNTWDKVKLGPLVTCRTSKVGTLLEVVGFSLARSAAEIGNFTLRYLISASFYASAPMRSH